MNLKRLFQIILLSIGMATLVACLPTGEEDTPELETPAGETPAADTPTAEIAATATPAAESPPAETPPAAEDHELTGTSWTLQSFEAEGSETPVIEDTTLVLAFDSPRELGGTGGCNSFGGGYVVREGAIETGELVSTLIACEDQAVMDQELRFYEALRAAGEYELSGDELTIWHDDGAGALHFTAAGAGSEMPAPPEGESELVGTQWQLESFGPSGSEMPVVEGTTVTLAFDSANEATGTGGCNSFGGEYEAQDHMIAFGEIVHTEIGCLEDGVMDQEQRYFEALRSAESFTQTADELTIVYDEGQSVLNFVPMDPSGEGGLPDDATRIEFEPGETGAQLEATIEERDIHFYVLQALEGQQMTVEISSPNDDVLLTVVGDDGMPLKRYQQGPPSWSGELPATQDYYIYAVSVGPATSYTLEVEVDPL